MHFSWSNALYVLPPLLLAWVLRLNVRRPFIGHSLLSWLNRRTGAAILPVLIPGVLETFGILCLCAALLNPVIPIGERTVENRGLNLVLVVDLSSSMEMPVTGGHTSLAGRQETRLDAVKSAIVNFVRQRKGDRIGVVVFSNNAYVVTPPTLDYRYVENYVDMINDRTLSDEGMTAIGEGLLTARDLLLRGSAGGDRRGNVIVLLTDGENNTGRPVGLALGELMLRGIKTYFIGVEVELGTTVENQGFNDAPALVAGVKATGGQYFDARNAQQVERAYQTIDSLEKTQFRTTQKLHDVPIFAPFAVAALAAFAAAQLLRTIPYFRELS
jgi:Ca-activated chloride channel family protein